MAETTSVACNQGDVGGLTLSQGGHDDVTPTLPSPETSGASELYVVTTILAVLSVVGTAGNALVLYVFSQKKDKLVSTLCIVVMASVDFITCLVIIPYTVFMEHTSFHVHSDVVCKLYHFLITSNIPFSALIMVAISIDRYLCICHPFTRALNEVRAKGMISVLAAFAAGIGVCVALMYGVYHFPEVETLQLSNATNLSNPYPLSDSIARGITEAAPIFDKNPLKPGGLEDPDGGGKEVGYEISDDVSYRHVDCFSCPGVHKDIQRLDSVTNSVHSDDVHFVQSTPVNTGECKPSNLILGMTFMETFQKLYSTLYLLCLVVVIILYALIYRAVLVRRSRRQSQQSKSLSLVVALTSASSQRRISVDQAAEQTLFTAIDEIEESNGGESVQQGGRGSKGSGRSGAKKSRKFSTMMWGGESSASRHALNKRDVNRMANVKTAVMLFVVTVVFIVTYLPAFLMALNLVPYNMTIFYMYFANNVANPVIYSFMNQKFRDDAKRLFSRR